MGEERDRLAKLLAETYHREMCRECPEEYKSGPTFWSELVKFVDGDVWRRVADAARLDTLRGAPGAATAEDAREAQVTWLAAKMLSAAPEGAA